MCLLVAFFCTIIPLVQEELECGWYINQVDLEGIRSCRACHVGVWLYGCIPL